MILRLIENFRKLIVKFFFVIELPATWMYCDKRNISGLIVSVTYGLKMPKIVKISTKKIKIPEAIMNDGCDRYPV